MDEPNTKPLRKNWERNFMRSGRIVDLLSRSFMNIELDVQAPLPNEPLLMAANHRSFADVFVAWICCYRIGRPTRFIVGGVFFNRPGMGFVLRSIGCIEGGKKSGADRIASAAINKGITCAIMPEGAVKTMDPGTVLAPLLPGVAEIWKTANCPFVAVGITGAGDVWRDGKNLPRLAFSKRKRPLVYVRVAEHVRVPEIEATVERVTAIMTANCEESMRAHERAQAVALRSGGPW